MFEKYKENYGKGYILLNSTCSCVVRAHNFIEFEQELTENVGVLQRWSGHFSYLLDVPYPSKPRDFDVGYTPCMIPSEYQVNYLCYEDCLHPMAMTGFPENSL